MINFICPVQDARITSMFGWRTIFGSREWHQGVDLVGNKGMYVPIYSSAKGIVRKVYRDGEFGTYGNCVIITHNINGKTYESLYAHLKSCSVRVGEKVEQGEQIGIMGNTGRSTGTHLHFEIHDGTWKYTNGKYPNAVDPMKFISLVKEPIKQEVVRMFKPSSPALRDNYKEMLTEAVKKDIINESWLNKYNKEQLTLDDAIALVVTIHNRK